MPDIGKMYDYEFLYPLEIRNPVTDEPIGITMKIRSSSSEAAKEVQRKHTDKILERSMQGKLLKGDIAEVQALEKAVSYIADWDWGDNTYNGEKPDLKHRQTVMEILKKEDWMYRQIVGAATEIENFSVKLGKTSVVT